MKKNLLYIVIILIGFSSCGPVYEASSVEYVRPAPVVRTNLTIGFDMFYTELGPYGRWIDYPGEGRVWMPNVEQGFRPYSSNGHWVYSSYGWTWASGYNWGWAAFHYGSWMYENGYGWLWVPGQEWAPAWVTWGNSGNYYGWAPIAPHININVGFGNGGWMPPQHYWNFVSSEHMTQVNLNNYVVNNNTNINVVNNITKNVTIINNNNNTVINNYGTNGGNNATRSAVNYNRGPQVNDVERATNNRIQTINIRESNRPGASSISNNELVTYKPQVQPTNPNISAQNRTENYRRIETPAENRGNNLRYQQPTTNQQKPSNETINREPIRVVPYSRPYINQNPVQQNVDTRRQDQRKTIQSAPAPQKKYSENKDDKQRNK